MRVLVTGASGLLGRSIMKSFSDVEYLIGTTFSRPATDRLVKCDLRDEEAIRKLLLETTPDVIIHCAAERRPDVAEKDHNATHLLNVGVTETLATLVNELHLSAWILLISSDYIFDGSSPPYTPNATPNPLSFYGKSKLASEEVLRRIKPSCGILRVPVLYGDVEYLDESSVMNIAKLVMSGSPVTLDNWQLRYPTFVDDVAFAIRSLVDRKQEHCGLSGTWHLSGDEQFTKYTMGEAMAQLLGIDFSHVSPNNEEPPKDVLRPYNAKLDTTALKLMGVLRVTPFRQAIKPILEKWHNK